MIDMRSRADVAPPAPDAVPAIEAVVHAGAAETHYRRAGSGAAVLLLFPGGAADPLAARLFDHLARRFRVIAPRPPAGIAAAEPDGGEAAPLSSWLRDLIDGLGLVRPGLVVHGSLEPAALAFSRTDPDRVGALLSVSRGASDRDDEGMIHLLEAETVVAISQSPAPAEPSFPC
jgi:pimeloyl-ACP methyl ester carboxylesterase